MPRDPGVVLEDILEAAARIREYTAGMDLPSFTADRRTADAVLRNMEIVGEAAKRLPEDVRARAPEIEARKVAGMRDMLAHAYFDVKLEVVWDVVQTRLEPLESAARRLLRELPG